MTTLADLVPDPQNRRRRTPRGQSMIADSFRAVGPARSIVIDESNQILAGNGAVEGASAAGFSKVLVVEADGETVVAVRRRGLTDEQKRTLAIYDNRTAELAEWNSEQLQLDQAAGLALAPFFETGELAELFGVTAKAGRTDPDAVPEMRATDIQRGDLFELGAHRLLCGDSTNAGDVARLMDAARARLIVTSPPYNQNLETFRPSGMQREHPGFVQRLAASYADSRPETEYQDEQVAQFTMLKDFLTPDASVFYNHKIRYRNKAVIHPLTWVQRMPYVVRQEIVWDRSSSITLNARMFTPADERIYWLRAGDDFLFVDTPEIKSWSSVWTIAAKNDEPVSAAFATEIPRRCLLACSETGDVTLEPYAGSGTTLIAAEQLNRACYALEIEPQYVQVAIDRWESFLGEHAVKVGEAVR